MGWWKRCWCHSCWVGNKKIQKKFTKTQSELILHIEDNQLMHMCLKDPMVIWETCVVFTTLVVSQRVLPYKGDFLWRKKRLINQCKPDRFYLDSSLHYGRIRHYCKWTWHDPCPHMGLPESYNHVIINFDTTPMDHLNFEHVVTHLLNEETQQNSVQSTNSEPNEAY
jgi:hypothetical protein